MECRRAYAMIAAIVTYLLRFYNLSGWKSWGSCCSSDLESSDSGPERSRPLQNLRHSSHPLKKKKSFPQQARRLEDAIDAQPFTSITGDCGRNRSGLGSHRIHGASMQSISCEASIDSSAAQAINPTNTHKRSILKTSTTRTSTFPFLFSPSRIWKPVGSEETTCLVRSHRYILKKGSCGCVRSMASSRAWPKQRGKSEKSDQKIWQ